MSKTTNVRTRRRLKTRGLAFETLDKRELMAADPAKSLDFIAQNAEIKAAEFAVIRTGEPKSIRLSAVVPRQISSRRGDTSTRSAMACVVS
ncbi:MAG: hypothetical protein ACKO3V_17485 [Pirellula sp.]